MISYTFVSKLQGITCGSILLAGVLNSMEYVFEIFLCSRFALGLPCASYAWVTDKQHGKKRGDEHKKREPVSILKCQGIGLPQPSEPCSRLLSLV
jgi:hypothetical protein